MFLISLALIIDDGVGAIILTVTFVALWGYVYIFFWLLLFFIYLSYYSAQRRSRNECSSVSLSWWMWSGSGWPCRPHCESDSSDLRLSNRFHFTDSSWLRKMGSVLLAATVAISLCLIHYIHPKAYRKEYRYVCPIHYFFWNILTFFNTFLCIFHIYLLQDIYYIVFLFNFYYFIWLRRYAHKGANTSVTSK